jgi:hypothetical protein
MDIGLLIVPVWALINTANRSSGRILYRDKSRIRSILYIISLTTLAGV